jgi:hypothetical protein
LFIHIFRPAGNAIDCGPFNGFESPIWEAIGRIRYSMAMEMVLRSSSGDRRSFEICLQEIDATSAWLCLDSAAVRSCDEERTLSQVRDHLALTEAAEVLSCKAVNQRREGFRTAGFGSLFCMTILELQQCVSAIGGVASGFAFMRLHRPGKETETKIASSIQKMRAARQERHVLGKTLNHPSRPLVRQEEVGSLFLMRRTTLSQPPLADFNFV